MRRRLRETTRAAVNTWRLVNDPTALMQDHVARHGATFALPLLNGPSITTGDPALVAELFGDAELFDAPNEISGPLVGEDSIVLASGARHKRKRKLLASAFHGERMRAYGPIIAEVVRRHASRLAPGPLDVRQFTQGISLEVIIRAVFGVHARERVEAFRAAIVAVAEALPSWLLFVPALQNRRFPPWLRYRARVAALVAMLREEIARGRQETGREDVLAMLLSARDEAGAPMSNEELLDELRTLVIAGHETTATTLAWGLWQLHRHPKVLETLRAEVTGLPPEELPRARYLGAVCEETLRMHPIAPVFRRRLLRDATLAGRAYPAGTVFHPSPMVAHFDPRVFPEPERFRPERFLERRYGPSELFPFGGGNRRCVGAAFASFELQVVLGILVSEHRFALRSTAPIRPVLAGVTQRPATEIVLEYQGRA